MVAVSVTTFASGSPTRRLVAWSFTVSSALVLCALTPAAQRSSQEPAIVLRAARVLNPRTGDYSGPIELRVAGGKIASMTPATAAPADTTAIDLGDLTVLPGLVDAHVHLQIGGAPDENARADLGAGFTTVVDLGATTDAVLRLRDAIASGAVQGPRILGAGLWVGTKNGVCEFGGIGLAGGPEAFRRRVRDNLTAGADLIKVCVTGWPADAFEHPLAYEIADDALESVTAEAHAQKKIVVAHAISLGGVKASLRARVDGLAHAAYLDTDTAQQIRRQNVFLVPTLASLVAGAPAPAAAALRDSVRLAHQTGVRLVFGTDGGVLPHGRNASEFVAMSTAGISAIDAIRAATVNAAEAFGLTDVVGGVTVGATADLIAIEGDPLRDVTALSRVRLVMRAGRIVQRARGR